MTATIPSLASAPAPPTSRHRLKVALGVALALLSMLLPDASEASAAVVPSTSPAPVVFYGSGWATVSTDTHGDVVFWYTPSGSSSWTREVLARSSGNIGSAISFSDATIATDGQGQVAIVAIGQGHGQCLCGWIGPPDSLTASDPDSFTNSTYDSASVAYSQAGDFVVAANNEDEGSLEYWSSSGTNWSEPQTVSGEYSEVSVTSTYDGVVIVASDDYSQLVTFFQGYFKHNWTQKADLAGDYQGISATTTSSGSVAVSECGTNDVVEVYSFSRRGLATGSVSTGFDTTSPVPTSITLADGRPVITVESSGTIDLIHRNGTTYATEKVAASNSTVAYGGSPAVGVGDDQVIVTDEGSISSGARLYGWTQAFGTTGWTRQVI